MNIEFLKLQKNDTDIKHILSRILPQLSFLIMLNFGHYANYSAFPGNRKMKNLLDFGPKHRGWPSPARAA
jgi:hypothetical protein